MAYDQERVVAQQMFEEDKKGAKEISVQLAVPLQTVYRWIKDGAWKQSKVDRILDRSERLKNMRDLVGKILDRLASADSPDKATLDTLRGYQKVLMEMEKTADVRGTILQGLDVFIQFMRSEHPESVDAFIPYFQEFPKWVRKTYPEIR
jgi:hypothetical protein